MATNTGELPVEVPSVRRRRGVRRLGRDLARQPVALGAGLVLAAVFLVGLIIPSLIPFGTQIHLETSSINRPPTFDGWHLFGTNGLGQDMLLVTIQGLHATEQIAVLGTIVATVLGVIAGGLSAFRGGWVDITVMRIADAIGMLPVLFILLVFDWYYVPVTALKQGLILAGYLWIPVARVVRAEVVALRSREFALAAVSLGASDTRIFFRHLLPNVGSTIIVAGTALFGQLIMIEALAEFLGLGNQSGLDNPTLGGLVGYGKLFGIALGWGWWTWAAPASALIVVLVCANLLGDGVAEALRPGARR